MLKYTIKTSISFLRRICDNILDINKYDVIGLGFIAGYYRYRKALKISQAINESKNRPFYMIGGHGPTHEPESFLKKTGADVIVMGEGERMTLELLDSLKDKRSFHNVQGIAFKEGISVSSMNVDL